MSCTKIAITFNPPWQIILWLWTSEHSDQLSLSLLIHPFGALLFCISTRHCNIIFSSFLHKAVGSRIYLIKLFSVKIHVSIRTCLSIIQYLHFKFLSPSKKSKWDQRFNLAYLHVPELSSSWLTHNVPLCRRPATSLEFCSFPILGYKTTLAQMGL